MATQPRAWIGPNALLAFLLELVALACLCWWGFATGPNVLLSIVLGVGLPVVAAVVWGLFAAPRARVPLPRAGVLTVKILIFGAATAALAALGQPILAAVFALVTAVNLIIAERTRARSRSPGERPRTQEP